MMSRFVFLYFILGFNSINIISASEAETDPVLSKASQLYDEGKYSEAISELTEAIEGNPKPEYYTKRGECYRKVNNVPNATIQDFRTAQIMRENPNNNPKNDTGTEKRSRSSYHNVVSGKRTIAPPLFIARSLKKQGKYSDAIVFYDQAVNANSTGEIIQERGECYEYMGDSSTAIANYQEAQEKMTNYPRRKPTQD